MGGNENFPGILILSFLVEILMSYEFSKSFVQEYSEKRHKWKSAKKALETIVGCPVHHCTYADMGTHAAFWVEYENSMGERYWRQFSWKKNSEERDARMQWIAEAMKDWQQMKNLIRIIINE